MKYLLIIIFLLSAICSQAQYLPATTAVVEQGLRYVYQEGNYSVLPPFPTTLIQDTTYNFTLSKAKRKEYFAIQYSGYVNVPSSQTYTFYIKSDDGSRLWVDGVLVVNNDGLHNAIEKSGTISLATGKHRIEVGMFNASGVLPVCDVQYSSPNITKKPIPSSMLFRDKSLPYYTKKEIDGKTIHIPSKWIKKGLNGAMDTLNIPQ